MTKIDYMAPDVDSWSAEIVEILQGTKGRKPPPRDICWAVLILDLQKIFVHPESPAYIPAWKSARMQMEKILSAAKKTETPVFWTRHIHPESDTGGSIEHFFGRLIKRADPLSETMEYVAKPLIEKSRNSAFTGTVLEEMLSHNNVEGLIICGVQTPLCVLATSADAACRGFVPAVVLDATAAASVKTHVAALEALSSGLSHVITSTEAATLLKNCSLAAETKAVRRSGAKYPDESEVLDLLVVGGGPAGIAAALQADRDGLSIALLTDEPLGGLLAAAGPLANTAGLVDGLEGKEVCTKLENTLKTAGIRTIKGEVTALSASCIAGPRLSPVFLHEANINKGYPDDGCMKIKARTLILAVGTTPCSYDLPGWKDAVEAGRAHRDIRTLPPKLDGGIVVVIGGGDAAWDTALSARAANGRVVLLCRADSDRNVAVNLRKKAAKAEEDKDMFNIMFDRVPIGLKLHPGGKIEILHKKNSSDSPVESLYADHVTACVGRIPRLSAMKEYGPFNRRVNGVLESPQGVFFAGDTDAGKNRYLLRALGSGQSAAIAAGRYLAERGRCRTTKGKIQKDYS